MNTNRIRLIAISTATLVLAVLLASPAAVAAARSVDEHRAADAQGQVEITVVSGKVEVVGWDKPEIEVAGTLGADVDKLDITTEGTRTTVRVVLKPSSGLHFNIGGDASDAKLVVHVPRKSSLTTSLVSADLKVGELLGNQELHTVSGDVAAAAAREARVRTVSGDIHLTAGPESRLLEVSSVSGDLHVTGGGGDVSVNTVSGDGTLSLGTASRVRIKSVSGDFELTTGLAADGRLEAESVSGDVSIDFTGGVPPAEFDLQSFSGDLKTCFGHKSVSEGYGPGSRLSYREGAGTAQVRVDTKSGDVRLCTKR